MSLYVRGEINKVKKLRGVAEEMGLEIVLYSDKPVLDTSIPQTSITKQVLVPHLARTIESTKKLFGNYKRAVSPYEVAEDMHIARNRASDYLNKAFEKGLIDKVPNTDKNIKGRYLFKPKNDTV